MFNDAITDQYSYSYSITISPALPFLDAKKRDHAWRRPRVFKPVSSLKYLNLILEDGNTMAVKSH